jgi:hypothetical protein
MLAELLLSQQVDQIQTSISIALATTSQSDVKKKNRKRIQTKKKSFHFFLLSHQLEKLLTELSKVANNNPKRSKTDPDSGTIESVWQQVIDTLLHIKFQAEGRFR